MTSKVPPSILIVEDDEKFRNSVEIEFKDRGYLVYAISSLKDFEALLLKDLKFAVIDLRLGGENGLLGLEIIKSHFPNCRVVIVTGYGTIATAVTAMKQGASSYITKPFDISTLEQHLWFDQISFDENQSTSPPNRESLDRHEHEYIEYVLAKCEGNISKAARWLNIHRQSLQKKLKKYPPNR